MSSPGGQARATHALLELKVDHSRNCTVGPRAGGGSSGERQGLLWKDSACKTSHLEKDNDHRISLLCGIQETKQRITGEGWGKEKKTESERDKP